MVPNFLHFWASYHCVSLPFICFITFIMISIQIQTQLYSIFFFSTVPSYLDTNQFSGIACGFHYYLLLPSPWWVFKSRPIHQKDFFCHAIYFCSHHWTSALTHFNGNLLSWICYCLCAHHTYFKCSLHEVWILQKRKSWWIDKKVPWRRKRKRKTTVQFDLSNIHIHLMGVSLHSLVQDQIP